MAGATLDGFPERPRGRRCLLRDGVPNLSSPVINEPKPCLGIDGVKPVRDFLRHSRSLTRGDRPEIPTITLERDHRDSPTKRTPVAALRHPESRFVLGQVTRPCSLAKQEPTEDLATYDYPSPERRVRAICKWSSYAHPIRTRNVRIRAC